MKPAQGLIQLCTGNGKVNTTAAPGLALGRQKKPRGGSPGVAHAISLVSGNQPALEEA
jgi:hypothetical protein